jgi:N-methylhydantoinase A
MKDKIILGVDTGGTFTDFVLWRDHTLSVHKVLSTPAQPEQAILQGVHDLGLDTPGSNADLYIVHGSTVATNAILEGKGVRTVFITNRGLRDMLTIGRQTRRELYNLQPEPVAPPVPPGYCLETGGRFSAQGEVVEPLTQSDVAQLVQQVIMHAPQAIAINLLFSYLDDQFEKEIERAMPKEIFVSRSSAILPEYKEYERGMTTWLNAYVGPLVQGYLGRLCEAVPQAKVSVMQSSGGTIAAEQAGKQAVHMVLSGPAGGMAAAQFIGQQTGYDRLLTFDMGGTSTDVALIDGALQLTSEGSIAGYPVAIPMVDMHTIGAGGGSIASVDAGGLLQVGPESAGAEPGPACYGKGGKQPTVTDANLVLGRLRADAFLGGNMQLDSNAAHAAMDDLATKLGLGRYEAALGVIQLANEHMAQALRVMSVQRGIDPRALTLVSFGGAGGLHVCALADALEIKQALVPVHGGVLSALGMIVAPRSRQLSHTVTGPLNDFTDEQINTFLAPLIEQGKQELIKEGVSETQLQVSPSLDLRYLGQSYYLNCAWDSISDAKQRFHQLHETRYGHQLDLPVELVNVRVALRSNTDAVQPDMRVKTHTGTVQQARLHGIDAPVSVLHRDGLRTGQNINGPALITETVSTTFIDTGWQAELLESGNLLLSKRVNSEK